jgi:hypothetical protein
MAVLQDLSGFGSKLVQQTMQSQLGGTIAYDWLKSGALVTCASAPGSSPVEHKGASLTPAA